MNAGTLDVNSNASGFYFVTMSGTATTTSPKILPNKDGVLSTTTYATNTIDYNYVATALTGVATEENSCGWFSDNNFIYGYTETATTTKLTADKTLYTKMATLNKLSFTVANGEASVRAVNGATGSIVIPRKYSGAKVTTVSDAGFANMSFSSITFGNAMRKINVNGFYGCSALTTLSLPDSMVTLGDHAFDSCTGVTEINFAEGVKNIGILAFAAMNGLKTITLPESATNFGWGTFANCKVLSTCKLPSKLTTICEKMFINCTALSSVTLPDSLLTIESLAFNGCYVLTSITIPNSVTSIANEAFYGCSKLVNITTPILGTKFSTIFGTQATTVTLTKGTSIPSSYFNEYSNLVNITLPDELITINGSVFYGCSKLESVVIPESVTNIDNYAFCECSSLTTITIPSSVKSIGGSAFRNCSSLTSVTIPNNVTSISYGAFDDCSSLTRVDIADLAKWCNISFADQTSNPLYYAHDLYLNGALITDLVLPNEITEIKKYVFIGGSFTSLTMHSNVTNINEGAFRNCRSLTNITIPSGVTSIGSAAFSGCSKLLSITMPNTVTSIGYAAFSDCKSLTSIAIPSGITVIEHYTFSRCSKLTSVTIPNTVTRIDYEAFDTCTSLTNVVIPNNITSISSSAFYGCSNLVNITTPIFGAKFSEKFGSQATTVTLTKGTSIPNDYFKDYSNLVNITLPDELTSIGTNAFQNCSSLTRVDIADLTAWCNINFGSCPSNPLYYAHDLYLNDAKITDLVIPSSITSIGDYVFAGGSFTSITIPSSVTSIGNDVFINGASSKVNITDLTKWCNISFVDRNSNPLSIAHNLYLNDAKITNLVIPSSITRIGQYVFAGGSFASITIPSSVTSIGSDAFVIGTSSKVNITDLTKWCNISFNGERANPLSIAHNLYLNDAKITDLVIPSSITSIGQYSFVGGSFTNVTIPSSVTSISNGAFSNTSLTSVTIPDSVTEMGSSAFYGCSSLKNVILSNSITFINFNVFFGCKSLISVTIPNSIKNIYEYAFAGCSSLTKIVIPDSVTGVGNYAFNGCIKLADVTTPIVDTKFSDMFGSQVTKVTLTSGTSIPDSYFSNCTSLASIVVPDSVTTIGSSAFTGCSKLVNITTPIIGSYFSTAFGTQATTVIFTSGSSIPSRYFNGYSKLQSITLPAGLTTVGADAFNACPNLTQVKISNLAAWCAVDFTTIESNPLRFARNLYLNNELVTKIVIPSSVTDIKKYAFYMCSATGLEFEERSVSSIGEKAFDSSSLSGDIDINIMASIGDSAFARCTGIENITFSGVGIGVAAFYGCTALKSLTANTTYLSSGTNSFGNCPNFTTVIAPVFSSTYRPFESSIPLGVKNVIITTGNEIPDSYFKNYTSLESVTLPNTITKIGNDAFRNCNLLTEITIPTNVTSIGTYAFSACNALTEVTIPNNVTTVDSFAFSYCAELATVNFPTSTTVSHDFKTFVFSRCPKLKNLTIPESVSSLGEGSFYMSGLETVIFSDGATTLSLGIDLFHTCSNLTSVTLGNRVKSMPQSMFYACTSLTSFEIPNTVTSLGVKVFRKCSNLATVTFASGSTIKIIQAQMFSECTKLTSVSFPSTITKFAEMTDKDVTAAKTFENCTSLISVTLPESIAYIGNNAFVGCTALTSATFANPAGTWSANGTSFTVTTASTNATNLKTTYVDYIWTKDTANVSNFTYVLNSDGNTYSVKDNGCRGAVVVPETYNGKPVTQIAQNGFKNNTNITRITLPYSITRIGSKAFSGCTKLTKATIENTGSWVLTGVDSDGLGIRQVITVDASATTNATYLRSTYVDYMWEKEIADVSNFTYVLNSDGNTYSVKDNGCRGAVVVPATYNGKSVTQIAENGFKNNTNITSMTLPDSVIRIGRGAFGGCSNLTSLTMKSTARWLAYNTSTQSKAFISVEDPVSAARSVKTYSDRTIEYWPNENILPF